MGGDTCIKRRSFIRAILRECGRMGNGDRSYRERLGIEAQESSNAPRSSNRTRNVEIATSNLGSSGSGSPTRGSIHIFLVDSMRPKVGVEGTFLADSCLLGTCKVLS